MQFPDTLPTLRRFLLPLNILLFGLPLVGCLSPQQMVPVAQSGIELSSVAQQAISQVGENLEALREAEFVAAALGTGVDLEAIEAMSKKMDRIRQLLQSRKTMFAELEKMYTAIKTLGEYDASGVIDGTVKSAASAVLAYANESRAAQIPAPESIANLLDIATKAIISGVHHQRLARANQGLADVVDAIVQQLENERTSRIAIAELHKVTLQNVLIGLVQKGVAWPHTLLASQAAVVGLDYDPKEFIRVYEALRKSDPNAFRQMESMLIRAQLVSLDRRLNIEVDVMAATISAMRKLAAAHRLLQVESNRIDIGELATAVAQLRIVAGEAATIAAEIRAAKAAASVEAEAAKEEQRKQLTQEALRLIAAHFGIVLPVAP